MSKRQKRILLPLLLILAALTLTACRPSTALTRLMNVANALNPSTEEMLTDEEAEEDVPDDEDPVEEQSDDGAIEELENTIGQFMEDLLADETTADQALQAVYSALAEDDEWGDQEVNTEDVELTDQETKITVTLPGGSESSDGQGTASGVTTSNGQESESAVIQPEEDEEEEEEEQENEEQEDEPETSEDPSGGENGGEEENKDLVNDENPESDYEELETAEGQVAATGQLAILVSMLGGGDRLCATSADYDENELAQKAFSDGDYEVLWDGDGSSPMSDGNFEKLLAMKPGLCVEISGYNTFSDAQIQQLKDASITYAAVDGFASADDIEDTVNELATLLGDTSDDGGTNAPEIAASYLDWCAVIEDDLSNISTSSEVVFIEGWDEDVQIMYEVSDYDSSTALTSSHDVLAAAGCAVIRVGSNFRPLSGYMGYANVIDWSATPHSVTWDGTYIISTHKYAWYESRLNVNTKSGDLCYLTPLYASWNTNAYYPCTTYSIFLNNMASGTGIIDNTWTTDISTMQFISSISFGGLALGAPDSLADSFATVITRDSATKQALEDSWTWKTNDTTTVLEYSGQLISRAYETDWTVDGDTFHTSISGDYNVYVNPTGLGDWVDGSAESILESVWIAWRVQGYYSESTVKTLIKDFYRQFYNGYELSDSELTAILAGPAS